jgi:hypothetical protein
MDTITVLIIFLIILFIFIFIFLPPPYKVLAAFVISLNLFDFAPAEIQGIKLGDVGMILFFIATIELLFRSKPKPRKMRLNQKLFILFWIYLVIVLIYTLVFLPYPEMLSIKAARHMVVGYCTIFTFILLFRDEESFRVFLQGLFVLVFLCTIVHIVQYFMKITIFFGYQSEYLSNIRSIPIFFPLTIVFFVHSLIKLLSGAKLKLMELIFTSCAAISLLLSFTRGIYFILGIISLLLMGLLLLKLKLKIGRLIMYLSMLLLSLFFLIFTGTLDSILNRGQETLNSLSGAYERVKSPDTFSFRRELVKERMAMISERNPIMGFGFIHEEVAQRTLHWRVGTLSKNGKKALATPDIAWANLITYTGFAGTALFIVWILGFIFSFPLRESLSYDYASQSISTYCVAFYLSVLAMLLLMMDSWIFSFDVEIPCFVIAGYWRCCDSLAARINDAET